MSFFSVKNKVKQKLSDMKGIQCSVTDVTVHVTETVKRYRKAWVGIGKARRR